MNSKPSIDNSNKPSNEPKIMDVVAGLHGITYPLMGTMRKTERRIQNIPEIIRHHGMDFIVPVYAMRTSRTILPRVLGVSQKTASKIGGIASVVAITANEISQGLGNEIIKQSRVSGFDYKDLIAAVLGYAYFKGLEKVLDK